MAKLMCELRSNMHSKILTFRRNRKKLIFAQLSRQNQFFTIYSKSRGLRALKTSFVCHDVLIAVILHLMVSFYLRRESEMQFWELPFQIPNLNCSQLFLPVWEGFFWRSAGVEFFPRFILWPLTTCSVHYTCKVVTQSWVAVDLSLQL
jgi:hypothetical protein